MTDGEHSPVGVRVEILRRCFRTVSFRQAAALVGILFDSRIVIGEKIWNPGLGVSEDKLLELEPLEPQAASVLVADTFAMDCDMLYRRFFEEWGSLKTSVTVKEVTAALRSDQAVHTLEWCSSTE